MSVTDGAGPGDVLELLRAQHDEARRLFSQLDAGVEGRRETVERLVRLLGRHEAAEEEVVYPALRSTGPDGAAVADARVAEEKEAKAALADLEETGVEGDAFDEKLAAFRALVLDHAEREEREVFPMLRASLDEDARRAMLPALEAAERMVPAHPHPHHETPEQTRGDLVGGPFVAMADGGEDADGGAGGPRET